MAVTGVYGDTGVAGGGGSGIITLTLSDPLPPNLQLPGNPTLEATPATTLPEASLRIANVAYVRAAIADPTINPGGGTPLSAVEPLQISGGYIQLSAGTANGQVMTWSGSAWVAQGSTGGGISLSVGSTQPGNPTTHPLWWNTTDAQLYVHTGAQFVIAVNPERVEGPRGPAGPAGPRGPAGPGIVPGTAVGQVLMWSGSEWFPATLPETPSTPTIMGVSISNNRFTVPTTASTVVGTLTTTIVPPAAWTGSYSLAGEGGTDNSSFTLSGTGNNTLSVNSGVTQDRDYHVSITATQAGLAGTGHVQVLTITGEAAAPPPSDDFSTEENPTGLNWTDGRPIYQKTVVGTAPNNTTSTVAHNISGLSQVIALRAMATTTSGMQSIPSSNFSINIGGANITSQSHVSGVFPGGASWLTLRYVKSGGPAGAPDFSTTERATGSRWIDDRPIYRKTWMFTGLPPVGSTLDINLDVPDFGALVVFDAVTILAGNAGTIAVPQYEIYMYPGTRSIVRVVSQPGTPVTAAADFICTMHYTKTTDSPSSIPGTLDYSTTEHSAGMRWVIDGANKPVYRKVVQRTGGLPTGQTAFAHNISNLEAVVELTAVGYFGSGSALRLDGASVSSSVVAGNIVINVGDQSIMGTSGMAGQHVVLLYTKTTD